MTIRKPLVTTGGRNRELPAGDSIALFGDLAATDQFADADGDIAEVEAATKALRGTLRPYGDNDDNICISRHAMGFQLSHSALTTFTANSEIITIMNLGPYPAALRKLGVSACTSALTGARVGLCRITLLQMFACTAMYNVAALLNPPIGSVANLGAPTPALKTRSNIPILQIGNIQSGSQPTGVPGFTGIVSSGRSVGEATGGAPSAIGTNIKPCWLLDTYGEEPFWIHPTMGLYLNATFPAAGTSQTVNYAVSMLWDEFQLRTPR